MSAKSNSVDMLHGPLTKKIILFALPIGFSSILQQLFNAADTSVVGQFADSNALAAVGTNGEIVALLVSLASGLAVGANVLLAKAIGEGRRERISAGLHTAISLSVILGFLIALLGQLIARPLLILINTPATVLELAVSYLKIYCWGFPLLMLYNFASAILRAKGDSRRPFIALTISGAVNVGLNLIFVIGLHLSVVGVALATDISTGLSAGMVLGWLMKETDEFHFSFSKLRLQGEYIRPILVIGIPSAIQGAIFCFANIFIQATINSFGAIATAGSTIAMNFEYFGYYMITAFCQAATTFTGQNFAAKKTDRCRSVLKICLLWSVCFTALITTPLTLWCGPASSVFSSETAVIEASCVRILTILIFEPFCTFYEIPAGILRGCGHSGLPAILIVLGICGTRIIWILTVFRHFQTLQSLFVVFPFSWLLTNVLVLVAFLIVNPLRKEKSSCS